jgi:SHOCT-like protein
MTAERKKVLEMLAGGKITAEEAEKLLDKLNTTAPDAADSKGAQGEPSAPGNRSPRFLRIVVDKPGEDQVNVRLPLSFLNRGSSLLGVLPLRVGRKLAEHGIDLSAFTALKGEDLAEALQETFVDIEKGNGKKVRIFCE